MMKRRNLFIKRIIAVFILITICLVLPNLSLAFSPETFKPDSTTEVSDADSLKTIGNAIVGPISLVASMLSVAVLIILGMKYMMGSAEERAEYKKTMLPYIIGAAMVFGITTILNVIVEIAGVF